MTHTFFCGFMWILEFLHVPSLLYEDVSTHVHPCSCNQRAGRMSQTPTGLRFILLSLQRCQVLCSSSHKEIRTGNTITWTAIECIHREIWLFIIVLKGWCKIRNCYELLPFISIQVQILGKLFAIGQLDDASGIISPFRSKPEQSRQGRKTHVQHRCNKGQHVSNIGHTSLNVRLT